MFHKYSDHKRQRKQGGVEYQKYPNTKEPVWYPATPFPLTRLGEKFHDVTEWHRAVFN